jgi:hypothetical protein
MAQGQLINEDTLYGRNIGSGHNPVIYQTKSQVQFVCHITKPIRVWI